MATLQVRNGSYRVLFCHGGRRLSFTVGRVDAREAELVASGVERLLLRVEKGLIRIPAVVDVVEFVRHDGRVPERSEAVAIPARPLTLGELRDRYLATHGNGALEPSTLLTARIHLDHVIATLGERLEADKLSAADRHTRHRRVAYVPQNVR